MYRCTFNIPFQMCTFQRALIQTGQSMESCRITMLPIHAQGGGDLAHGDDKPGRKDCVPYAARWHPGVRTQEVPVQHTPANWFKKLLGTEPKDLQTHAICLRFAERL